MADLLRPVYVVRVNIRPATAAQTQGPANRLALTAVQSAAPFAQLEWTNPQRKTYPVALRTHINPFPINLYGKDQFFAAPGMGPDYDYPNPLRKRPAHVGFTSSILPILYGQDTFFGPGGYGPDYDYPNPRRRPAPHVGYVQGSTRLEGQDVFFGPPGYGPNYDYPNPTLRRKAQQPEVPQNFLPLSAPVATPFFGFTFDNPRRPIRLNPDFLNAPTALALQADNSPPYSETANPFVRRVQQPQTYAVSLALTAQPAAVPFAPQDFANPRRGPGQQPQLAGRSLDPQAPVTPASFDNPRRAARQVYDFTSPNLALFIVVPAPFVQADWPNPLRRAFSYALPHCPLQPSLIPIPVIPPVPPFWTPITGAAGAWSAVADLGGVWTPLATTPKTWTPQ